MAKLTKEQLEQVKKQLMEQISSFPAEQQQAMKEQISTMNDTELEEFLIKNKMISSENQENPFRMIVEGKIPSYKISETNNAIAVLEINPISEGHTIIIPKTAKKPNEIPEEILEFSKNLSEQLKQKLNCKEVIIQTSEMFGEAIINLLPVYKNETLNSKRKKASEDDLRITLEKIISKEPEVIKKPKKKRKTSIKKLPKAPKRIP